MKTKTLLLLCLFLGFGLTHLSAQNGKNGTGTIEGEKTATDPYPVLCNGIQTDLLEGEITFHYQMHFKNGVMIFAHARGIGEVVSKKTGEKFIIMEKDPKYKDGLDFGLVHLNLRGDNGTHYIFIYRLDYYT
jgi:hypothetical protein